MKRISIVVLIAVLGLALVFALLILAHLDRISFLILGHSNLEWFF